MKTCIRCKKEIKGGCYTDEDAIKAIKIATEQMLAKNDKFIFAEWAERPQGCNQGYCDRYFIKIDKTK
ncbi:hypothetical protein FACS1894178_6730 [Bacteroidia bacterium]|nr:hypothetical protein FACS1894178_6730 [Bacteroidia bacterium]